MKNYRQPLAAAFTALLLAGCVSLDPQASFAPLQTQTQALLNKDLQWPREPAQRSAVAERVSALLDQPMTADSAVQIALLNHQGLQASQHQLGIADAERVQASQLPNPGFSIGRMTRGSELEIERGLHFNLLGLISRAPTGRVAHLRLQQVHAASYLAHQRGDAHERDRIAVRRGYGHGVLIAVVK